MLQQIHRGGIRCQRTVAGRQRLIEPANAGDLEQVK
jgi:hypothetical protein